MESLLDNPMKAVLYLKELTTIVQNQQSLIQTQRQRIDDLERKVQDLIGENRRLRDPHQHQHHQHQHQHQQPQPQHQHQHPPPPPPRSSSPPPTSGPHPAAAGTPGQAPQHHPPPPVHHHHHHPPPPPPPHHHPSPPRQLQLVPAATPCSSGSPPEEREERARSPRCRSLVPQPPVSFCRSAGLARKAENQTVLHQFCCPAPDAPDAPESDNQACVPRLTLRFLHFSSEDTPCVSPEGPAPPPDGDVSTPLADGGGGDGGEKLVQESPEPVVAVEVEVKEREIENEGIKPTAESPEQHQQQEKQEEEGKKETDEEEAGGGRGGAGGGRRPSLHHTASSPMRVQRNGACSHANASDYELSLDLKNKQIEMLEHKYGGHLISRRAACKIQTAFRQYQLSKNFEKIRNSLLESRLPRRISLRKVRVQNAEGFSAERALAEGCSVAGIPLVRSPSLPVTVGGSLTDLEDSFTEQVQSLAKSIDDALSNWSMKTMCSLQEGSTYQFSSEAFATAGCKPTVAVTVGESGTLDQTTLPSGTVLGDNADNMPRNASKLMMAFRDVTVQIDSQSFHVSSSVRESSTSVSLGNCVQQGATVTETLKQPPVEETKLIEHPPPPQEPIPPPPESDFGEIPDNDFPAPPPCDEQFEEDLPPLALEKTEAPVPEVAFPVETTEEAIPTVGQIPVAPTVEVLEAKRQLSDPADNSSEQMSSSSTSTSARSASEASSKEALQTMMLSLPRYHCENPSSCKSPTLSTDVMRKRLYRIGLNLFNVNPDKGLQFLISRGFIPDTPIGVAHFLLQRKGLSRQMIGEFLGNSKKPFNRDVLE
ncbi:IQ motif and SEC7 domain-containing protein 3 isoform X1, partial [Silurus meridionalis]